MPFMRKIRYIDGESVRNAPECNILFMFKNSEKVVPNSALDIEYSGLVFCVVLMA